MSAGLCTTLLRATEFASEIQPLVKETSHA